MKFQALAVCLLALYLQQGEAIKCHQCTSATESKCSDPVDSSLPLTECTPDVFKTGADLLKSAADQASSLLGKIGIDMNLPQADANTAFACLKGVRQDGDKRVVIRSCSIPKTDKFDPCSMVQGQGIVTHCSTCDSDGCNSASGVAASVGLLLLALAALLHGQ